MTTGCRHACRWSRRSRRLTLVALAVVGLVMAFSQLPAWSLADLRAFDYLSTIDEPRPPADSPIVVAIDEPSLADINAQWPWPRELHARLVESLRKAGASAIGLDIIFAEPSNPASDDALAKVLGPDVVLAGDESLIVTPQADQLLRTTPLPAFTEAGAATGIASITLGGDGVFRDLPGYDDGFAMALARIVGKETVPPAGKLVQSFGPSRSYPTVSYYQALDPENMLPKDIFKGRVVIVGLSLQNAPTLNSGGADAFATSYTVHTGQLVPGAEIQATIFDNLTSDVAITRAGVPVAIGAVALAALLAAAIVRNATRWQTIALGLFAVVAIGLASFALVRMVNVFVSPIGPTIALLLVAAGQTALDYAEERRRRREIVRAFSQYLSPALVERLARDPSQLKLGGERRTLSILFCDVRGFTTIAEALKDDPEQLTALINRLLTPLSDIVLKHGGTIDKYIGDCLMAFWNAPLDDPRHAHNSVAAALDMLDAMAALNAELRAEASANGTVYHPLRIGIGINTGDCVVGNMGSLQRFDYSVLGDAVNLASRLEGASKMYGVSLLIGEQTATFAEADFAVLELDRITVKGRTTAAPVYTVVRSLPEEIKALHARFVEDKYAGDLTADDTRFDRLADAAPALVPYYQTVRSGQFTGGA
jgi:adenylate cyclase